MFGDARKARNKTRFSSLHRKWLASLSLLLLILGAVFGALNYWSLEEQIKNELDRNQKAWNAEFRGLIKHSIDRLQRLSIVIASLGSLSELLENNYSIKQTETLEQKFSSVGYELDVERIIIFNKQGEVHWNWSPENSEEIPATSMIKLIQYVKINEHPKAVLDCQSQCGLNIVMPLLSNGEHIGFIGIRQRITDIVMEFATATSVDIGILVPIGNKKVKQSIHGWRLTPAALTNAKTLKPFIESISTRFAFPMDTPSDMWLPWKDKIYLFTAVPLKSIISDTTGYLFFISDITESNNVLMKSTRNSILIIIGSIGVAEVILFLLLRNPLMRLSHLAKTLPLVAKGEYHDAYKSFKLRSLLKKDRDEIDILFDTSIDLTYQIEKTQRILAADKDFIQGILDSAHVMILTQTRDGKLTMVNQFMSRVLGRTPDCLKKHSFIDLLQDDVGKAEYMRNVSELFSSSLHRLEHEGSIIDINGETRHIIWIHTSLNAPHDDAEVLSVGMDATDRIMAENRSRWLAHHDPLTGLANRRRFYEELEKLIADSNRNGSTSALLLLDLDNFKSVNDNSGHAAGDALLMLIAKELRGRARKTDLIARLGGDEFALLMPRTTDEGAKAVAISVSERLANQQFLFGNNTYKVSASIGIVLMPQHGKSMEELMNNVDTAMYEAKNYGKGRWILHSSDEELALRNY